MQKGKGRLRRTMHLAEGPFFSALESAMRRQQNCLETGAALFVEQPLPASGRQLLQRWREPLQALLKAFVDAALPAGGLPLDTEGRPAQLAALIAAGRENARNGECNPKLLGKVRRGAPIDERIALAALHFFRLALDTPALALEHIGGMESQRLAAVKRASETLNALRDAVPASVLEALQRKTEETAGYAQLMVDGCYRYASPEPFLDAHGMLRLRLHCHTSYRSLRIAGFAGELRPIRAYEWHEWNHIESASLHIEVCDEQGQPVAPAIEPKLRRRVDEALGYYFIEIDPHALGAERSALRTGLPGRQHRVHWTEVKVFNAVDRDLLVNLHPMNRLCIQFDEQAHPELELRVGDSPGLLRTADGWQLDRTLLPREVLNVRLRLRAVDLAHPEALGASGEWLADRQQPVKRA